MHPDIFQVGRLTVHSYGLMLAISFLVGIVLARLRARKLGMSADVILDLAIWIVISSVVGARIFFIVFHLEEFRDDPLEMVNILKGIGGLTLYGGFILAILASYIYTRRRKIHFLLCGDVIAPAVAIGITITRIGCFLNGCCFGTPTTLPWGMVFPPNSAAGYVYTGVAIHPTQIYSVLYGAVIFLLLLALERYRKFEGFTFFLFVLFYSVARFLVDFPRHYEGHMVLLRLGSLPVSVNQGISLAGFALALCFLFFHRRLGLRPVKSDREGRGTKAGKRKKK